MSSENHYPFSCKKNISQVLKTLRKYGLAVIPNYLDKSNLVPLRNEFHNSLTHQSKSIIDQYNHPINKDGRVSTIDTYHNDAIIDYPNIITTFKDPFMDNVSKEFFFPNAYSLNKTIFCSHEKSSSKKLLPWHFDRMQSLKFWFYLNDVTKDEGAFEYSPGSHWEGKYRAGYSMLRGLRVSDIPNDIDEELIINKTIIEMQAGDLLIFDSDGLHSGGIIKDGRERKVLRGHTFPKKSRGYYDKIFTKGWWLTSMFNLSKLYTSEGTRIIGRGLEDNSKNRKEYFKDKK